MDKHYFRSDPQLNNALQEVNHLINQRITVNNTDLQAVSISVLLSA